LKKKEKKAVVRKKRDWKQTEKYIMLFIFRIRRNKLTAFMRFMTRIGDGWLWFLMDISFLLVNISAGLALCFASLLQLALHVVLKRLFTRERPFIKHNDITNLAIPPDRFSFPSGHTAAAFAVAFVFLYFYPVMFIPMLVIASLIAFSRIYLGMHYPSDVFAGGVLGFLAARLSVYFVLLLDI
jgi:undecaprenyl-diphosphatase